MAIYLGNNKLNLIVDGIPQNLFIMPRNIQPDIPDISSLTLFRTLDNYILKDLNNIYIVPKDSGRIILESFDDYILKDNDDIYIIAKGG